ncbi:ADP-ribosylglycohydrolase family protein [Clostridium saccharoperbutylacetonicum]|uniref:ADP-ribosylglycohydrolase family protein n=1 Tax=Clostridium saccharoperbutylacetonicum TaxID=36745 RepID=UPI000983AC66|nr:ADP-ribosylglycohydrolase family protein [Clostridium saccharoperbutylacetonicum]AQR94356.1 ADP-ribosyl-[dinitrogen reductase] glycohydrolase [Clostridium saccharoperbutylacetonicum]NSB30056.1 ADP-ribosylglycohydrolase [Clostridium saccharoperbutylacetonicum]
MSKEKKQLSLIERWKLDIESYKKYGSGENILTATPQCEKCKHFLKGNALHCKIYDDERKPEYVIFISKECPKYESIELIDVKINNQYDSKMFGGVFGFCVGDALGVPVEFSTRDERKRDPVKEMRAYGTYHQPFGTWSDDTSLTLCLIEGINNNYSLQRVADNFIRYYRDGYLTPYCEVFDIGNSTKEAINKMIYGIKPIECGGKTEQDNGNGSLMRVLPLAYYAKDMLPVKKIEIIEEISSLTHSHKRSKFACIFYVEFVINLLNANKKDEAYKNTIEFVNKYCTEMYSGELDNYRRVLDMTIASCNEEEIKSSGYVIDTLEAAMWSFLTTDSYNEAVLKAINLGGDTDTIAAIVGGMAGTYYGFESIPNNWVQNLARKLEIYEMLTTFRNVEK